MTRLAPLFLAAAALAMPVSAATKDAANDRMEKALAGRVAGSPVRCISLSSVTSSQIIGKEGIIYQVGGRMFLNRPQSGADRLRDWDVLLTRSNGTQLCRADTVDLIDQGSRAVRSFVVLGDFVPYTLAKER